MGRRLREPQGMIGHTIPKVGPTNTLVTIHTLDGRQLRYVVPKKSTKKETDTKVGWSWVDKEGTRQRLTLSLYGLITYEESEPSK